MAVVSKHTTEVSRIGGAEYMGCRQFTPRGGEQERRSRWSCDQVTHSGGEQERGSRLGRGQETPRGGEQEGKATCAWISTVFIFLEHINEEVKFTSFDR